MPTQCQPNAASKETTYSPGSSFPRALKPKYDAFWGVFDGYIRSFRGTKRALINRLKRISYINFTDDLRVLDEDGRVVYGDIEFGDVKSPEYGNFFSDEEWSECTNCLIRSEQEIDDICAKKEGYYFGKQYAVSGCLFALPITDDQATKQPNQQESTMETAVFFGLNSGDRTSKNFSTARRYLNDGTDDYNYTVDFGSERYVEFRVCVRAASRRTAINKAMELIRANYSYIHLITHDLIKAEREATARTWWENEFDNSIYFDRGVARRQEASLNRMIEEMRDNKDCKWSVQFVN